MTRTSVLITLLIIIGVSAVWMISGNADRKGFNDPITTNYENDRKSGPALFYEYHYRIRTRSDMQQPLYSTGYRQNAYKKALAANVQRINLRSPLPWIERGPGNVGGRTRGLIVDPRDSTHQTWYAGSVGGGVWKTSDAGQSWRHLTEELTNLGTSTLAMSPADPDIIYLGTGEGYGSLSISGNGIWKSTDSGENWEQLTSTKDNPRFGNIMRMAINPNDPDELLAATRISFLTDGDTVSFIMKSLDGGQTWTEQFSSARKITQIIADPSDFQVMYAAIETRGIVKTIDGGATWNTVFDATELAFGRMEIAIAPQNTAVIYISAESFVESFELYRTLDSGQSWNRIIGTDAQNEFGDIFSGQGWYDNSIVVHPFDPNIVFVGGAGPIIQVKATEDLVGNANINDIENNTNVLEIANIPFLGEGVLLAEEFAIPNGFDPEIETTEYVDVEIFFDEEQGQKAHRFEFSDVGSNSELKGYDDVPFQVWDVDNDRQLMVSFIDADGNGIWFPDIQNSDIGEMEAIIVHALPYEDTARAELVDNLFYKAMYLIFPFSTDLDATVFGRLAIDVDLSMNRAGLLDIIVDGYLEYDAFPNVGTKGVHVDHHNLIVIPIDSARQSFYMLNANDGGVAFSTDSGQSFVQTGDAFANEPFGPFPTLKGYNTAQFYGVDKMNGADRYVGGTQDNGSWLSGNDPMADSDWKSLPSGDGFEAAWHYQDSLKILESSQFNVIYKSEDGGESWRFLDLPGRGPFLTRIANSKQDPELVFAVSNEGVLRSRDFGDSWEVIEMPQAWTFSNFLPIEVSLASPYVIWTGDQMTESSGLAVSKDGGSTFEIVSTYELAEMGAITGLATHPYDPRTAYALFSMADGPKILKTTDLGESWTDISGFETNRSESTNGFPDVAIFSLVVMPYDTNVIWAGTEIGLFESLDGGQSWHYADNGMPPASIWEMKIVNDEVVLATHGRGIWTVEIPELADYTFPDVVLAPTIEIERDGFNGRLNGTFNLRDAYDSSYVQVEIPGYESSVFTSEIDPNEEPIELPFTITLDNLPDDTILIANVSLFAFSNELELVGSTKVPVYDVNEVVPMSYANDFDSGQRDFARLGFNEYQAPFFDDAALHSPHPYDGLSEYISILQVPVLIGSEDVFLSFDEVVLVETGDSPDFGSEFFYDYVVVEGTSDGGNSWTVLEGYDSSYDPVWEEAYNDEAVGNQDLFLRRSIKLNEFFEERDLVYIRFRLVADPFVEGWGWAIDNINIGDQLVDVDASLPEESLSVEVFPNPIVQNMNLRYHLPERATVRISLFDTAGRLVKVWDEQDQMPRGDHQASYTVDGLAAGIYFVQFRAGSQVRTQKVILQR